MSMPIPNRLLRLLSKPVFALIQHITSRRELSPHAAPLLSVGVLGNPLSRLTPIVEGYLEVRVRFDELRELTDYGEARDAESMAGVESDLAFGGVRPAIFPSRLVHDGQAVVQGLPFSVRRTVVLDEYWKEPGAVPCASVSKNLAVATNRGISGLSMSGFTEYESHALRFFEMGSSESGAPAAVSTRRHSRRARGSQGIVRCSKESSLSSSFVSASSVKKIPRLPWRSRSLSRIRQPFCSTVLSHSDGIPVPSSFLNGRSRDSAGLKTFFRNAPSTSESRTSCQ